MRMVRFVLVAVVVVTISVRAGAQPLADRIPEDALFYVGWAGSEKLAPGYAQSHLKGVLDSSNLPELFSELGPRIVRRLQLEQMMEGEMFVREVLPALLAVGEQAWKRPTALYSGPLDYSGKMPTPKVAFLVDAGKDAQGLADRLDKLVAQMPPEVPVKVRVKVLEGGVLCVSTFDWPAVVSDPLSKREEFVSAMKQGRPDAAVTAFFDAQKVVMVASMAINVAADAKVKQMWQRTLMTTGVAGIKRLVYTAGFDGKDWGSQAFIEAPQPRTGMLSTLLEAEPVDDAALANAPKSSTWVAATRFDVGRMLADVRAGVAGVVPEAAKQVDEAIAQLNAVLGLDFQKDLLATLGDQWVAFNSAETGRGILGMVVVHPLKDAAKFEQSMSALEKKANAAIKAEAGEDGPELSIETSQIGGVNVHYFAVPALSPCWAVKGGKLYAALFPQILVAAMEYDGAGAAGNSFVANEDFRAMKKRLGVEKPISVSYMDLPKLAPRGYQMVLAAQRTALGFADMFGLQTPAMALPPLNKIQPHLSPSIGLTWTDDAGWHYRGVTPFPGADVLGGEQALVATAAPIAASVALPALAKARQQARTVASLSNMRQIGLGVHMYANDNNGDFPPDLGSTLKYVNAPMAYVIPDHQEMVMMASANMKPEEQAKWVNEHSDYAYVGAGLKMRTLQNTAQRIIAHEKFETSKNGLVNVLYADGHADVQPVAFVKQQVEQQKKQAQ